MHIYDTPRSQHRFLIWITESGKDSGDTLDAFFYVREYFEMKKKPSTSELLDWISALRLSGLPVDSLRQDLPLLSFLIKKDEDLEDVKKSMGGLR